jgi:hypothetical protein
MQIEIDLIILYFVLSKLLLSTIVLFQDMIIKFLVNVMNMLHIQIVQLAN